jgi:16S rRNA (uracil1498-N3)-methyltransferase
MSEHFHPDHVLFFTEDLTGEQILLSPAEAVHATTVLRLSTGSPITLTDGKGCTAEGTILSVEKKTVSVTVTRRTTTPRPLPEIFLYVGLPERDAFESLLYSITPFEVAAITPVTTAFTQKPWWKNKWENYRERFTRKMITALKQSRASYLPRLQAPVPLSAVLDEITAPALVADQNGTPLDSVLLPDTGSRISCFTGPPGGFSRDETGLLAEKGCRPVKIARNRLRTELAATTLVAQITAQLLKV